MAATGQAFIRPPDNHPIYNLIGRVAAEWARLEHHLDQIIWELSDMPKSRGACVTAQLMSVWPRYNSIIALLKQRTPKTPELKKFIEITNELNKDTRDLSERRNRIIHDSWYSAHHSGETSQFRSMARGEWSYDLMYRSVKKTKKTLENIKALEKRVEKLKFEILNALSS